MLREDNHKHRGARKRLLEKISVDLKKEGLFNEEVINAMDQIPRHVFFDSVFDQKFAYENKAFQIGAGQTISQPFTVAAQSYLLHLKKRQKVLEIGTGSGYQAAVLAQLGYKVFSIERQKLLFDRSKSVLRNLGYKVNQIYGDGFLGFPTFAPFDGIIVTCGAPHVPQTLKDQLVVGGNLVIPVGEGDFQTMYVHQKQEDGTFTQEEFGNFSFVPMLEKTEK